MLVPLSVHAGLFSSVFGENVVRYDARQNEVPPNEVSLLNSKTNADPNAASGGGDIIVDGDALVPAGAFGNDDYTDAYGSGEISIHTVRPCNENSCETLSHIAEMYDVSVKTIMWANNIKDPNLVQPGDELVILPIVGVRHIVKEGDTIKSIAEKYEGDASEILSYNQLASASELSVGETLIIPGGNMHTATPKQDTKRSQPQQAAPSSVAQSSSSGGGGYFTNPLPSGVRTQGIHGYNAVDIAAAVGTTIRAAADGEVIVSRSGGWNGGYGNYVVVKHNNGTQTLYAHMSSNAVGVGAYVSAGEAVGYVGSSGRSTGAHLHFEVRGASNPF